MARGQVAGIDLIVGAHPHVVQDTSHVHGVPVIYSMGNAVSNMSKENTRLELAVHSRFVNHPDGHKEMLPRNFSDTSSGYSPPCCHSNTSAQTYQAYACLAVFALALPSA